MFNINYYKLIVLMAIPVLRKSYMLNFLKVLISPIVELHDVFMSYRSEMLKKVVVTPQVWSIRKLLNDTFDPDRRRIEIDVAGSEVPVILNRITDEPPYVVIHDMTMDGIVIHNFSAYGTGEFNGVIITPYQLTNSELSRMRALVDANILFGINYNIISAV